MNCNQRKEIWEVKKGLVPTNTIRNLQRRSNFDSLNIEKKLVYSRKCPVTKPVILPPMSSQSRISSPVDAREFSDAFSSAFN